MNIHTLRRWGRISRPAIHGYLWNLGTATSIWLNAAFWPGARRGETMCAHCARSGCRFCITLGRIANRFEPDHLRKSHLASRAALERSRDEMAITRADLAGIVGRLDQMLKEEK